MAFTLAVIAAFGGEFLVETEAIAVTLSVEWPINGTCRLFTQYFEVGDETT